MRHSITLEGYAFRLRPVTDADADFIVSLRTNPVLSEFLHPVSGNVVDQFEWLERYYARRGDFYFVIENRKGGCEGLVSIYDLDSALSCGEWGRWILRPGSLAAVESAFLIYRTGFEVLTLHELYCRTVADNKAVVSFHDSCGITNRRLLSGFFSIGGVCRDAVEHRVDIDSWEKIRHRLMRLSQVVAKRVGGSNDY